MAAAFEAEKKGDLKKAETEFTRALNRAQDHLDPKYVADSLYYFGAFYRRHGALSKSIRYLRKALEKREQLYGAYSEETVKVLALLSAAYYMDGNLFEGRQYAIRLKQGEAKLKGEQRKLAGKILQVYEIDENEYAGKVNKWRSLALAGDPKAQYELAKVYFNGPDGKEMLDQILALYEASANQNYADAQYYLGFLYDRGIGVRKNDAKARKWYRMAAENGLAGSQYNYAVFLLKGRGGAKNEKEGLYWLRKAGEQGYVPAKNALSRYKD